MVESLTSAVTVLPIEFSATAPEIVTAPAKLDEAETATAPEPASALITDVSEAFTWTLGGPPPARIVLLLWINAIVEFEIWFTVTAPSIAAETAKLLLTPTAAA